MRRLVRPFIAWWQRLTTETRRGNYRPLFRLFLVLLALPFALVATLYLAVWLGLTGPLPTAKDLRTIQNATASEVYSADGVLLGKYFIENRTNIEYAQIAPAVIDALVATEDARFYEHEGVDLRSLGRVVVKSLLLQQESAGGGSTLSQQLAKNLFPRRTYGPLTMPINKLREMMIARRLERVYSKQDILTLYLNTVPFGGNLFGIEAGARRFFNVPAAQLTPEQAAVLVGMLKATTSYNPKRHPERAQARRNVVLSQMVRYQYLDAPTADSLKQLPLKLDYHLVTHNDGLAPYLRAHLRRELQAWCEAHTKADGTPYNLYTDGLKIYTTVDSRLQAYAEKAVARQMARLQSLFFKHWNNRTPWDRDPNIILTAQQRSPRYRQLKAAGSSDEEIRSQFQQKVPMTIFTWDGEKERDMSPLDSIRYYQLFLNAGFLAMRPQSGEVLAWVGGINHKYFQYDHVRSRRQVGSTFKPIVYAAALESGVDPCAYIPNERRTYEEYDNWSPGNAEGNYEGFYSMQGGLTHSVNTVAAHLIMETGIDKVSELAHRMGVQPELPEVPSLALGTASISLYDMVSVYATLANRGAYVPPHYLVRITDARGQVLDQFAPDRLPKRVMKESTADLMTHMLESVVDSGTARRLRTQFRLPNDIAGKTGTTQSHADGWFIGYTPELVAGAWVGAEDPRVRFRTISLGQGSATALPIWGDFMQQVNKDPEFRSLARAQFPELSPRLAKRLDCEMYRDKDKADNIFELLFGTDHEREKRREERREHRQQGKKKKNLGDRLRDLFGG
ncbi:penicillin-binding protein 1A [Catalinimonas alkaloidigena]|uniref:Penicillin-binding protein 1A n=2 Tax=Catalinimonas alkaloidigena TaxID=1075417 RepID=A0A1G9DCC8_9BACT|nr:penicillin-binding protein 1A [Catalinimonas alkaloidigena]